MTKSQTEAIKKSRVNLSDDEEYKIFKYCVENRCIALIDKEMFWRMEQAKIAAEINNTPILTGRKIKGSHVRNAVNRVIGWINRLEKEMPVLQETAEIEQLKIKDIKNTKEIEELKYKIEQLEADNAASAKGFRNEIERLNNSGAQATLNKIKSLLKSN